jgi:hypothetical protein
VTEARLSPNITPDHGHDFRELEYSKMSFDVLVYNDIRIVQIGGIFFRMYLPTTTAFPLLINGSLDISMGIICIGLAGFCFLCNWEIVAIFQKIILW